MKLDMEHSMTAGWGELYESDSTDKKKSSCMTNHEGPVKNRFKICDLAKVTH